MRIALIVIIMVLVLCGYTKEDVNFTVRGTLLNAGVPTEEVNSCLEWAFGKDYWMLPLHEMDTAWNRLHIDIFMLHGYDPLIESLERIGRAYMEWRQAHTIGKE